MPDDKLVGFAYNTRVFEAKDLVTSLTRTLGLEDRSWVCGVAELAALEPGILERTSVIVTAGGDGTILQVSRIAAPYAIPLLGINLGRVGFMTEVSVAEAAEKVPYYLSDAPRVEERMMLQATVMSGPAPSPRITVHALNDVVLSRGAEARLLDITTMVDNATLYTYRADGVIAATATGSTGYALSAGGPIIFPEAEIMLIQPLAAHLSFQTGVVVSGDSVIEFTMAGEYEGVLTVDGFADTSIHPNDRVVIQRSPYRARFLRAEPASAFYSTLTQRLGIAGRRVL